jgi:type 1 glutamine amidotransferase
MHRRQMLAATGLAALGAATLPSSLLRAADPPRRKVLMFTKSAGFEHSSIRRDGDKLSHAEQVLTDLGKKHGFEVTCTKDGRVFDGDIGQYDAFVFYTTGDLTQPGNDKNPPMSPEGKAKLLEAVAGGKGFVGSHCASDTFHTQGPARESQSQPDPYIAMLGGEFISHGPQQVARQALASPKFPGVDAWTASSEDGVRLNEEWYSLKNYADNLHVILVQDTQGMNGRDYERPPFPATWARKHGKGRVFYTSMGHREDVWTNDKAFQPLLLGGLAWAMGDVEFDPQPNMEKVCPGARVMPPA